MNQNIGNKEEKENKLCLCDIECCPYFKLKSRPNWLICGHIGEGIRGLDYE